MQPSFECELASSKGRSARSAHSSGSVGRSFQKGIDDAPVPRVHADEAAVVARVDGETAVI